MALSTDLVSQFVKITKDDKKVSSGTTVYGTVIYDDKLYVKLDGSELLTPASTTTNVKDGERVTVTIQDHTATINGNISSPSARTEEVNEVAGQVAEMDVVMAHKVTADDIQATNAYINKIIAVTGKYTELEAITAEIENLRAEFIEGEKLKVTDLEAVTAKIETIEASLGNFVEINAEVISTEDLEAINAEITNLKGYTAEFTYLSAVKASIKELDADKLSVKDAEIKYVDIGFANVDEAWFDKFYAESGMIDSVTISEGVVVKELVGVTIKGDLIEAGTLKVDRLIVKGSDGEYYRINTDFAAMPGVEPVEEDQIHGSTIVAKSIAATKLSVEEIAAFEATIGGFHIIGPDEAAGVVGAIYSGAKADTDSSNPGIYLGQDGQVSIGDMDNYIRFRKVSLEDGTEVYKLEISADSILFGDDSKASLDDIRPLTEHVKIRTWVDETGNERPCVELAEGDSDFKQRITNVSSRILDGERVITEMDTEGIESENVTVRNELRQGDWAWVRRDNGNLGLIWKTEVAE